MSPSLPELDEGAAAFEDGTPSFLAMPAISDGLRWFARIGVDRIDRHVQRCTASLLDRVHALGDRVIVYGPHDQQARGRHRDLQPAARQPCHRLRAGRKSRARVQYRDSRRLLLNPGAAEQAFRIAAARARTCLKGPFTVGRFRDGLHGTPVAALRASVGLATSDDDLDRLAALLVAVLEQYR